MNKIRVHFHGEPVEVQALAVGEKVFWNGRLCTVKTPVPADGIVTLTDTKTGADYWAFAGFCTTMAQAY